MSIQNDLSGTVPAILAAKGEVGNAERDAESLRDCIAVLDANHARNVDNYLWYEGKQQLRVVPDFVPAKYRRLSFACPWPEIAVQSVVERSQFDGFVFDDSDGDAAERMKRLSEQCDLALGYQASLIDCLVFGVSFATVVRDDDGAGVRWHSPLNASAIWNHRRNRIKAGMVIVDRRRRPTVTGNEVDDTEPCAVDLYVDEGVWELTRGVGNTWAAEWMPDGMGRPRMVAMRYRPDSQHVLGRSRISKALKDIAREYMSNALNLHVASEYTAIGQKWATGLTDDQLTAFAENKWKFSADNVVLASDNPVTGTNPQFGNFTQQSMEPILSVKRSLATDFAAAASIPISEIITADSNPTSAEALAAAKDKLISLVESVNLRNKRTMRELGLMLLAVDGECGIADLTDEERGMGVHFRDPSTPSMAACADSTLKIAQSIEGFGETDVALERVGFDEGERKRIRQQIDEARASGVITAALMGGGADVDDAGAA